MRRLGKEMIEVLKCIVIASGAVFIAGTIVTLALIPVVVAKGLPSLGKKDVAGFLAATNDVPKIVRTVLVVRRIQSIAWMVALAGSVLALAWSFGISQSK